MLYRPCLIGEELVLLARIVGRDGTFIATQLLLLFQFFVEFEMLLDSIHFKSSKPAASTSGV